MTDNRACEAIREATDGWKHTPQTNRMPGHPEPPCPHCGGDRVGWEHHNMMVMRDEGHPGFNVCERGCRWPAGSIDKWKKS